MIDFGSIPSRLARLENSRLNAVSSGGSQAAVFGLLRLAILSHVALPLVAGIAIRASPLTLVSVSEHTK